MGYQMTWKHDVNGFLNYRMISQVRNEVQLTNTKFIINLHYLSHLLLRYI